MVTTCDNALIWCSMQGRLIDKVRVFAKGGGGGQGSPKLGGFGGDGGDVIARAHRCSLVDLARRESRRFIAGRGQHYRCVFARLFVCLCVCVNGVCVVCLGYQRSVVGATGTRSRIV